MSRALPASLSALALVVTPAGVRADEPQGDAPVAEAGVGLELAGRRFSFTDALSANARDYAVAVVPAPYFEGEVRPFGATKLPVLRDLGVEIGYARAFGLSSRDASGDVVGATWDDFRAGLRLRLLPWGARGVGLGVSGGLVSTRFAFDASSPLAASLPSVTYTTLRAGVDARFPLRRVAILARAGYDGALRAGDVHERFRGSSVGGIDLGAGVAVALAAGFEARITGSYTRYFYAFDPVPGDAYVAGGALDQLYGVRIGATYAY